MSTNSKYDWATQFPRMVELYKQQLSIPKICTLIQDEAAGFTPKKGMVYKKFRDEGYPTAQVERTKFLKIRNISTWKQISTTTILNHESQTSSFPRTHGESSASSGSSKVTNALTEGLTATYNSAVGENKHLEDMLGFNQNTYGIDFATTLPLPFENHGADEPLEDIPDPLIDLMWPDIFNEVPEFMDQTLVPWSSAQLGVPSIPSPNTLGGSNFGQATTEQINDWQFPGANDSPSRRASIITNISSPSDFPSPFTQPEHTSKLSRPSSELNTRLLGRAKLRPKYNRSCTPEKRNSTSTFDSGYVSRRNSPLPVVGEHEHFLINPTSLSEFRKLYRVPCKNLHEPRPLMDDILFAQSHDRFKNAPKCSHCHYSGIHNLSWSCRYLSLGVFKAELNLRGIDSGYDVTALDAAGNSALHYAAAGGAGWDHISALIHQAINPYQINTAGQLFLHCLRPWIRLPGFDFLDDGLVDLFIIDLINLMNTFQPTGGFSWPDNEGYTALDYLALRLTDNDIKRKTFQKIESAGYAAEVANQFTKARRVPSTTQGNNFAKLDKAWGIIERASEKPLYIDPETGDNVLHALSRIRLTPPSSLVVKIENFVSKDVDLNLHNFSKDSPLASFIQERPFHGVEGDETGATMSKYLDALMWKDPRRRIPNRINVNMRNREGATALYYAAIRGRPDSVRSLIEGGANVNARIGISGHGVKHPQGSTQG